MAHDQVIMCQIFKVIEMKDISSVIHQKSKLFLDHIKLFSDSSRIHHFTQKNGGFPVFMIDNRDYYEQSYFEELIENSVWRYLVNGVFRDLFSNEYCLRNSIACEWQEMNPQLTSTFVEVIEDRYFVEFTIRRDDRREGYRYTNRYFTEEQFNQSMNKRNLDFLFVIDFSSDVQSAFLHPLFIPQSLNDKIQKITLKEFFTNFFSATDYDIYVQEARKAVKEAYQYVGKQTITNLTSQQMPFFRKQVLDEVLQFSYTTAVYKPNKAIKQTVKQWLGNGSISEKDKQIVQSGFFDEERYRSLVGSMEFARSFITSEYLYQTLKNNSFDLTSIVTGYFKSIEQLLYLILGIVENDGHTEDVWIQSMTNIWTNKAKKMPGEFRNNPEQISKTQVRVRPGNRVHYDTTFAALVYALQGYKTGWSVSSQSKDVISAWLLNYSDECRNEHLHKENIYDIAEVETIRTKTYLLMYYVLGGYNFAKNGQNVKNLLGILDNSIENMYHKIMEYGPGNYFYISFSSDSQLLVALPTHQRPPVYDQNGLLKNPSLRFVIIPRKSLDDWRKDDWGSIEAEDADEKTVTLTRNNMPTGVEYIDKISGKSTPLEW